jgi:hypothetical protein
MLAYDVGVFVSGSQIINILGLGYSDLIAGPSSYIPFWDSYLSQAKLTDIFAMNLCSFQSKSSFIEFGTADLNLKPNYTAIVPLPLKSGKKYLYYVVQPTSLKIDANTSVAFPTFKDQAFVIIDSGTTQIMLNDEMLQRLGEFYGASPYHIDPKFWDNSPTSSITRTITAEQFALLKPLVVEFPDMNHGTFTVTLDPSKYTQEAQDSSGKSVYISNFASVGPLSSDSVTTLIFGNTFMQNAYVIFDRANTRIGFASNAGLCS